MAHTCPNCQQACYCDGEDTFLEGTSDQDACIHECDMGEEDDEGYGYETRQGAD